MKQLHFISYEDAVKECMDRYNDDNLTKHCYFLFCTYTKIPNTNKYRVEKSYTQSLSDARSSFCLAKRRKSVIRTYVYSGAIFYVFDYTSSDFGDYENSNYCL